MPEYIEREKAVELVTDLSGQASTKAVYSAFWKAAKVLKEIPTADVVKVVRCKDCLFYFPPFCNRPKNKLIQTHALLPNDFCSFGELKELGK